MYIVLHITIPHGLSLGESFIPTIKAIPSNGVIEVEVL